jgi:hypothetical protein|tara:strand:+ start:182 stop:874 length:693 start_codon:yes stop_codon:yes gene_type:complete
MNNNLPNIGNVFTLIYLPQEIIINLILSFILGLIISVVYKFTHKGLSYSQSFMITNIFVAVIVCMVIMIIGNSLARAFALVGALSIIRFRTVVKDTKDTAYIFWSLAVGMASGTGSYFLAIAGTFIITSIALILHKTNFGSIIKSEFILQFRTVSNNSEISNLFNKTISKFSKSSTLLSSESSEDGESIKLSFDIILKDEKNQTELLSELSKIKELKEITIIAAKSDVDY